MRLWISYMDQVEGRKENIHVNCSICLEIYRKERNLPEKEDISSMEKIKTQKETLCKFNK